MARGRSLPHGIEVIGCAADRPRQSTIADSGSARNAPSAASGGARSRARRRGAAAQSASRAQRNSGRQPSRRASGANASSNSRARPALGADVIDQNDSPPGLSTRTKSSSVASGSGTAVMTYCATTASKDASGNASCCGVHHRQRLDIAKPERAHALLRLAQHRLGNIDAAQAGGRAHSPTATMPVPTPTSRMRPPIASASAMVDLRPRSNTLPNTRS